MDAGDGDLSVMSVGFLLPHDDNAVIWRGPRKSGLIKQFLTEVDWGELDFLIIDTPPGTSDEHISVAQYLKLSNVAGAIVAREPVQFDSHLKSPDPVGDDTSGSFYARCSQRA